MVFSSASATAVLVIAGEVLSEATRYAEGEVAATALAQVERLTNLADRMIDGRIGRRTREGEQEKICLRPASCGVSDAPTNGMV